MPTKPIHQETVEGEKRNAYQLRITFNKKKITEVTITDHYQQKPGREKITDDLILELLKKLDGKRLRTIKYSGVRKIYKWETVYQNQPYRLIFWFKDGTTNHLWTRNCYSID